MSLRKSFQIAIKALRKNKLQTALTMIGITIGVATVLTMVFAIPRRSAAAVSEPASTTAAKTTSRLRLTALRLVMGLSTLRGLSNHHYPSSRALCRAIC